MSPHSKKVPSSNPWKWSKNTPYSVLLFRKAIQDAVFPPFKRLCKGVIDSECCLTNVQHRSLVFQAPLWDITLAFEALIFTNAFFGKSLPGLQGYYSSLLPPSMIALDVYRWRASHHHVLHSFRGDELALSDILQLLSSVVKHRAAHFPYRVTCTWTLILQLCQSGLWYGPRRVSPSAFHVWPGGGHAEWLPLSTISLWGKTHALITTGPLVVALCEGIPTCDWGCEPVGGMCEISVWEGWRPGSSSERQREWASCRSNITYGPADLERPA